MSIPLGRAPGWLTPKELHDGKKGLRSRLTRYGDEEFALFLRRGFLKGAGYTDDALERPIVGVLSTASDFNPCHKTAPQVAEAVAKGVRLAGGLPFIFPTISLHEAFAGPVLAAAAQPDGDGRRGDGGKRCRSTPWC